MYLGKFNLLKLIIKIDFVIAVAKDIIRVSREGSFQSRRMEML